MGVQVPPFAPIIYWSAGIEAQALCPILCLPEV
jgi:hypothetical protein